MKLKQFFKSLDYKKLLKETLVVILGSMLLAFAVSFCFINYKGSYLQGVDGEGNIIIKEINGVLSGGTTAFSLILNRLFFQNVANADFILENIITVTTVGFFILGSIFLGKKFILHTLVSTLVYPLFIYIFRLPLFDFVHEQFCLLEPIIDSIIGGLIMGVGCGIVYKVGGSTGGFDIPGLIINKFFKVKLSIVYLITDGLLVALSFVANYTLYEVIIGLVSVLAYSFAVDICQSVGNTAYYCDIITEKYVEVKDEIISKLDRGVTVVDVVGGYTGTQRKMLKTLISKNQYVELVEIVKNLDTRAFMSVSKATTVFGEGYSDFKDFSNK